MSNSLVGAKKSDFGFELPSDVVFERAPSMQRDSVIAPTSADAMHLEGSSANGGIVEYLHVDDVDGVFRHEMKQDIEPYLKRVHDLVQARGKDAGKNIGKDMYLAASVPHVVLQGWLNERQLHMSDFKGQVVKDFLNDQNNKPFRVWQGKA